MGREDERGIPPLKGVQADVPLASFEFSPSGTPVKSSQDFTLWLLPPSKGESESPATLSGSQDQASSFAGGA